MKILKLVHICMQIVSPTFCRQAKYFLVDWANKILNAPTYVAFTRLKLSMEARKLEMMGWGGGGGCKQFVL